MQQSLINLLNNSLQALSYSDQDKKIIVIDLSRDSESVTIRFSDNGPGLNPDSEKMLFQFLSPTSKPGSMGLGLWLCQYIIEKHRGKIWYQKSPYGGAQFNIVIYTKIDIPATTNQHHDNAGHV